jgi:hypothetical protein
MHELCINMIIQLPTGGASFEGDVFLELQDCYGAALEKTSPSKEVMKL